jgi:hypothetical protein
MTPRACSAVQFSEGLPALKLDYPDLYEPRLTTPTLQGNTLGKLLRSTTKHRKLLFTSKQICISCNLLFISCP